MSFSCGTCLDEKGGLPAGIKNGTGLQVDFEAGIAIMRRVPLEIKTRFARSKTEGIKVRIPAPKLGRLLCVSRS